MLENGSKHPALEGSQRMVAFIDLLGFSNAVEQESNFEKLYELLSFFVNQTRNSIENHIGITQEGNKTYTIHPSITAFSDSLVVSYPLGSILPPMGILLKLCNNIAAVALKALAYGFLIRGGIAQGRMCHENGVTMGRPFNEAVDLEKNAELLSSKNKGMPRIRVSKTFSELYQLDKPPRVSKGGRSIEVLECMCLLVEKQEDQTIYSVNYIRDMLCLGVPHGDSWWEGIKLRVNEIREIISNNKHTIKLNSMLEPEKREEILSKWSWFENQFEREANFLLRYAPAEQDG
jgi:hypothetical protein